ncbi:MAG: OmpA family protein [Acidiferrobacter sp.]
MRRWRYGGLVLGVGLLTGCAPRSAVRPALQPVAARQIMGATAHDQPQTAAIAGPLLVLKRLPLVVHFATNSAALSPSGVRSVRLNGDYLLAHPSVRVRIEGNCDIRGSAAYNLWLGERRARTVAKVLRGQGVPQTQIGMISYGKSRPIATANTKAAWALDRRVDIDYAFYAPKPPS